MQGKKLMLALALAAVAAPATIAAQDRRAERERTGEWEPSRAPQLEALRLLTTRRARLGVVVNLQARETDSVGALIESVTPNGPADKAGLRGGDVITRVDGQSLTTRDNVRRPADRSVPGLRLIELAAKLEPRDSVAVEYRREGQRRTTTLVTSDEPSVAVYGMRDGTIEGVPLREFRRTVPLTDAPFALWMMGSPLGDIELAAMNSELGQYFGVDEGVLVIRAPKSGELNLRGGDVVLTVDGRTPSNPQHLLRILRSYEPGEQVRFEVQRNRRRETVTGRITQPERRPSGTMVPSRTPLAPSRRAS